MPNGSVQATRVRKRIAESAHSVTVVFPAARVPAAGTSPGSTLANPLLGPPTTQTLVGADPTPMKPSVTMQCIWTSGVANLASATLDRHGWHSEADAMARVDSIDAETAPGKTHFDACDHVEHDGRHFVVLQVQPVGPGFAPPHSYSVWLKTQRKQ
jgi:hypothetical protein